MAICKKKIIRFSKFLTYQIFWFEFVNVCYKNGRIKRSIKILCCGFYMSLGLLIRKK